MRAPVEYGEFPMVGVIAIIILSSVSCGSAPDPPIDVAVASDEGKMVVEATSEGYFRPFVRSKAFACDTDTATSVAEKATKVYDALKIDAPPRTADIETLWIADVVWHRTRDTIEPDFVGPEIRNVPFGLSPLPESAELQISIDKNTDRPHLSFLGAYPPKDLPPYERDDPVVVAVLDTGVRYDHVLLKASYRNSGSPAQDWHDGLGESEKQPVDESSWGHGTAVASLISGYSVGDRAEITGAAPMSRWIACRVWRGNGNNRDGSLRSLLSCLQWALAPAGKPELAPHVVNLSGTVPNLDSNQIHMVKRAMEVLECAGIVVVAAAGNTNGAGCKTIYYPPQTLDSVLTVGALADPTTIDSESRRGPTFKSRNGRLIKPDVVAPGWGTGEASAGNTHAERRQNISQTSGAAPLVSGVIAAWLDQCKEMRARPSDVRSYLRCHAKNLTTAQDLCGCKDCIPDDMCKNADVSGKVPKVNGTFGYGYPHLPTLLDATCLARSVVAAEASQE